MNHVCPSCGSSNIIKNNKTSILSDYFGGTVEFSEVEYQCIDCEMTGDFFNDNEDAAHNALSALDNQATSCILSHFEDSGIGYSHIERALKIPQRTLTKWKNGHSYPASYGITLLKFIHTFPWLLDVAEHDYHPEASRKIFLGNAINDIIEISDFLKQKRESNIITVATESSYYNDEETRLLSYQQT